MTENKIAEKEEPKKMLKEFDLNKFEFGKNLYIDASAGTGKTYTIQNIAAELVGKYNVPLSKILIVTYTEKAAGELRDRIRQEIENRCNKDSNDFKENYRKALTDLHIAPIFTIHSFCQKVLHDFAFETSSALETEVVSDDNIKNVVESFIRDKWQYDKDFIKAVDESYCYSSFDKILEKCEGAKENWDILNKYKDVITKVIKKDSKKIKDLIEHIQSTNGIIDGRSFQKKSYRVDSNPKELNLAIDYFYDLKEKIKEPKLPNCANIVEAFVNISKAILNNENQNTIFYDKKDRSLKIKDTCGKNCEDDLKPEIDKFLASDSKNKINITAFTEFVLEHFKEVADYWKSFKRSNKQQAYSDMINNVHKEIVNENKVLIKQLQDTYRYAIIDEFQDTNQLQWDIFKGVFLNSSENNIIVVGDPKQSIYSFQGADVSVYRNAIKEIGNGSRLKTNYRSSDDLINACNKMFAGEFFNNNDFENSDVPSEKKLSPTLNGNKVAPFWISDIVDKDEFAKFAVKKIVECCSLDNSKKTALQIFDKDKKILRNVKFSDFAILARTRSEMPALEKAMAQVGIPYVRYKDTNLFSDRECAEWIALLKALNAPDFSGYNRKALNEALVTDFFRVPIENVDDEYFIEPNGTIMNLFIIWRKLVQKKRWAELQESIYQKTEIDKFLCTPQTLQNLTKIRQIGNYIFDYLYNKKISLEEMIKYLQGLNNATEDADNVDDNIVEKGSDYDAVKLMTIHASKGLAFAITIITGGLKKYNDNAKGPFTFSDESKKYIGFDKFTKDKRKQEELEEFRRLMYVAYTRAESLIIAPRYKCWYPEENENKQSVNEAFLFLKDALEKLFESEYARKDCNAYEKNDFELKEIVKNILANDKSAEDKTEKPDFENLQKAINSVSIYRYSYSSLKKKEKTECFVDGKRYIREENMPEILEKEYENIDCGKLIQPCENYEDISVEKIIDYPKGANVGDALHKILEKVDFEKIGNLDKSSAINDNDLLKLIESKFTENSIECNVKWFDLSARFIWNTLNSELPEIIGNKATGKNFCLKELKAETKKSEMRFDMKSDLSQKWLNKLCYGFIDLLFVRKIGNENVYSILDWKSDTMDDYCNKNAIAEKIEKEYSVQRVLYSYSLIMWLKQFYNCSEEEIFEKHFGGIYYALVRGTCANNCNGIYAQTWSSFSELQKSYNELLKIMNDKN